MRQFQVGIQTGIETRASNRTGKTEVSGFPEVSKTSSALQRLEGHVFETCRVVCLCGEVHELTCFCVMLWQALFVCSIGLTQQTGLRNFLCGRTANMGAEIDGS